MADVKVAAVIQARMGSTRLPGKVLMPVAGKPLLEHIIDRLRLSRTVDTIVIATSDRSCDDPLVTFAEGQGVELVRGAENNVLQRFGLAAEAVGADVIVRVTGDSPLIDPATLDLMVDTLLRENAEYCAAQEGVNSVHEGFCVCTRVALNRLLHEAANDPVAIEHVTAYFVAQPDEFRVVRIPIDAEHRYKGARLSIDTPADVKFIEAVYRHLGVPAGEADVADVVRLLNSHPELLDLNGHVYQKKATDVSRKVLFRCDGDRLTGLGHVVRCLALAHELREKHGCGVIFAMAMGESGFALVQEAGFPVEQRGEREEATWLETLITEYRPNILVLDVRNDLGSEHIGRWRRRGLLVVSIDDPTPRRLEADLLFYPPIPQISQHDWNGFGGELCVGWEWVLLRQQFSLPFVSPSNPCPRVLVSMGGSDPENFTLRALSALDSLEDKFETLVVVGSGFAHESELERFMIKARRSYRVERNVCDMASLMNGSDLAIASFGVTAYELAAMGVPAVYICLSQDHALSASKFVEDKMALNCGVLDDCRVERVSKMVHQLLANPELRHAMGQRASVAVDGRGAARIASKIMEVMKEKGCHNG